MLDRELVEHAVELPLALVASEGPGLQDGQDVFLDRHLPEDGWLLSQIADSGPRSLVHRSVGELDSIQQYPAFVGENQSRNKVEGCGLSRAIGAEKSHN